MSTQSRAPVGASAASTIAPLWRNPAYLLLWSGQAISEVGNQASQLAFPLLILSVTHSPIQAGIASALRSLVNLVVGLPAGAFIDQWDRKRTMILCDIGRAITLGSIAVAWMLHRLTIGQIYLVAIVEGMLFVFFSLAESSALPHVVAKTQLPAATAQREMTDGVATLIGPSLGGILFGIARALPFLIDAISYVASVVSLSWLHVAFQDERTSEPRHLLAEIREGCLWIWREPIVRALVFLHTGVVFAFGGLTLLAVVIAQHLHANPATIGLMFGISGIGAIFGAWLGGKVHQRWHLGQIMVTVYWLYVVIWPLLALAPSTFAIGAIIAALWIVDEVYDVVQISYRLAAIPDALRGRVRSVFLLLSYSALALSATLTGGILQRWGIGAVIFVFEMLFILLAVATTCSRALRSAQRIHEL
jgi:predicted MFS family arabinose efflux permease